MSAIWLGFALALIAPIAHARSQRGACPKQFALRKIPMTAIGQTLIASHAVLSRHFP